MNCWIYLDYNCPRQLLRLGACLNFICRVSGVGREVLFVVANTPPPPHSGNNKNESDWRSNIRQGEHLMWKCEKAITLSHAAFRRMSAYTLPFLVVPGNVKVGNLSIVIFNLMSSLLPSLDITMYLRCSTFKYDIFYKRVLYDISLFLDILIIHHLVHIYTKCTPAVASISIGHVQCEGGVDIV